MPVQGLGHELFPRSRFTIDKHRDIGAREAPDGSEYLLHGRCLANDFRALHGLLRHHLLGLAAVTTGAPYLFNRLIDIKWLRQVLEGPTVKCRYGAIEIRMGGHDDDRQVRAGFPDSIQQRQPIHAGHADIRYNYVGSLMGQGLNNTAGIGKSGHRHIGPL